jgi:DNA-binding transcriptional MerR regulator
VSYTSWYRQAGSQEQFCEPLALQHRRSWFSMAGSQPIRKNAAGIGSEIPDKLYFRIGEVARLCEVPAYVLRFWESEFPQLKPNKGGTGQRLYRRRDVEMAIRIKRLLYDEGYTIPGARQVFKSEIKQKEPQLALPGTGVPDSNVRRLREFRRELQEIAAILSRPVGEPSSPKAIQSIRTQRASATAAQGPNAAAAPVEPQGRPLRRATRIPTNRPLFDLVSGGPATQTSRKARRSADDNSAGANNAR